MKRDRVVLQGSERQEKSDELVCAHGSSAR